MRKFHFITLAVLGISVLMTAQTNNKDVLKLSMEQAVAYAIDNGYQSQSSLQDVYYSKKQVWEATAIGLPQVSSEAKYNFNIKRMTQVIELEGVPTAMQFGSPQDLSANITVSQIVFDGSYLVGLQSAKTVAKIAQLAKEKTEILVIEAVSNAYMAVLVSQETIKILDRNIVNVQSNIGQVKAMFENGLTEEQDVEQLELNLSILQNSMNQNRRVAEINAEMLKFVMGLDITQPIALTDNIENILLANYEVISLEEALDIEDHVEFKISVNNLKTKDLLVRYEKTKYIPNISAFFNAGYNGYSDVFDFFQFKDDRWFGMTVVGAQLNIPIFSGFQRKARVDMAKIDYEKSRINHEQLMQNLFLDLHKAQNAYAYSIDSYLTNEKNMKLAERIEHKENIKYKEGISTSLDLTNAQNQLYVSQQNYLNAILLVVQSKISLDKALNKL